MNSPKVVPLTASEPEVIGVVLAGGKSERMGFPKALLEFKGETLLSRAVRMLEGIYPLPSRVIVSGTFPNYECLPDKTPGLGPLGGLATIVDALLSEKSSRKQLLTIVPIDMPLLTSGMLSELLAAASKTNSVAHHYEGFTWPLVLTVSEDLWETLNGLLHPKSEQGAGAFCRETAKSVNSLLGSVDANAVPSQGFRTISFKNVNTPADWQEIAAHLHGNY